MSVDHSQPNSNWLEMMKTNARETSRLPSTSIGTGRHSARIARKKKVATPSSVRALGALRAAAKRRRGYDRNTHGDRRQDIPP